MRKELDIKIGDKLWDLQTQVRDNDLDYNLSFTMEGAQVEISGVTYYFGRDDTLKLINPPPPKKEQGSFKARKPFRYVSEDRLGVSGGTGPLRTGAKLVWQDEVAEALSDFTRMEKRAENHYHDQFLVKPYEGPDVVICKSRRTGLTEATTRYASQLMEKQMRQFNTSASSVYASPESAVNHGKHWTGTDEKMLERTFKDGANLAKCCVIMGRTTASILAKLCDMGLIWAQPRGLESDETRYFYVETTTTTGRMTSTTPAMQQIPKTQPTEDITMINSIETRIFINGQDASKLSDDTIFDLIRNQEKEIANLEATKTKPKKLTAKIAKMQEDLAALVTYVDAR